MKMLALLTAVTISNKTKHYRGLPPALAPEGRKDQRQEMRGARFLTIEERPDGIFLTRFRESGECIGDTWHQSIGEAKGQAAYEYEGIPYSWMEVPDKIGDRDIVSFALGKIKEQQ